MSARLLSQRSPVPATLHPVYLRLFCETLQRRGVAELPGLLRAAGLPAALDEVSEPVELRHALSFIRLARRQCSDALLAVEWGRRVRSNMHGNVGTAIFSSANLRQALQSLVTLMPLRCANLRLSLRESGSQLRLCYEPALPLYELEEFIATVTVFALQDLMHSLLGRQLNRVCFELPFAPPVWVAQRGAVCSSELLFHAPMLAARLPLELLDRALPSADAPAHAAALRQCQPDLRRSATRLSERLAAYLGAQAETFPTLAQAADYFHLSPRSLRRGLQQEGESFQKILDRVRMDAAALLLEESALDVQEVARRLAYQDASNFIRAFRRRYGQTPRQFREAPRAALMRSSAAQGEGA